MSSYLYKVKKNLLGKRRFVVDATKCPFEIGDIVYVSTSDDILDSRWCVSSKDSNKFTLEKNPYNTILVKYKEMFNINDEDKFILLDDNVSSTLEKYFIHKLNINSYIDESDYNNELKSVVQSIRNEDFDIELHVGAKTDYGADIFSDRDYNFIISKKFGVIAFKCEDRDVFSEEEFWENEICSNDKMRYALERSKLLTDDDGKLNIGYKKCYVFESSRDETYYEKMNNLLKEKCPGIYVCNKNMFIDIIKKSLSGNQDVVDEKKHYGIMHILLPQYIVSSKDSVNNEKNKFEFISQFVYELDDNQRDVLRNLNKRTFLKSTAGSGKTILLLAKAYEVAVANPNKKFLFLCYNRKLFESIKIQANNTGKNTSNLEFKTFDMFLSEVTDVSDNCEELFQKRRSDFVNKVKSMKCDLKFGGIFIDEVQQLMVDSECISALFSCLDEEKYMVIAGDYYQQIRIGEEDNYNDEIIDDLNDENTFYIGEYDFQIIVLDDNYRNAEPIVKVINKMLEKIYYYVNELDIPISSLEKDVLIGKPIRKGVKIPRYYNINSDNDILDKIKEILRELLYEEGCSQNDILFLSPYNNYYDKGKYSLIRGLEDTLSDYSVSFCNFSDDNNDLTKDGIRIGTIGKSIGLDFKAVIIFGTELLNKTPSEHFEVQDLEDLKSQSLSIRKDFIRLLKNIYVACSRAKDTLIVIDNLESDNLISEFLSLVGEDDG